MPISINVKNFIKDARFTAAELVNLENNIQSRQTTLKEAEIIATNFADTLEAG
ncbi:MAG: hypothetical protein HC874_03315 [Richelia sp. SL_2_1]|nr:hypothetical protein [Richelia sp. SM1_7_0]NJN11717.1 hypothetical protein [Richelia sp. RM1_1_1]NJO26669.1 hypothetical protein [Richelia sp. SL_2_1]